MLSYSDTSNNNLLCVFSAFDRQAERWKGSIIHFHHRIDQCKVGLFGSFETEQLIPLEAFI